MKQLTEDRVAGENLVHERLPLRTKTGCLTCRQRRKKCDEKKPQCSGCERNFLDCVWPAKKGHTSSPASQIKTGHSHSGQKSAKVVFETRKSESPDTGPRFAVASEDEHIDRRQDTDCVVQWVPRMTAFVGAQRAAWLTPCSSDLLAHYLSSTSTFLTAMPAAFNPFINIVMPLSYSDDLLMHSVLALSGTHLSFQRRNDNQVQLATYRHYRLILTSLRASLTNPDFHKDASQLVRLILILVVVCHVEAVAGEPTGGIFPHLKACRILILKLIQDHDISTLGPLRECAGFAIETYLFLALSNSVTPFGRDEARTIPFDPFFSSLDVLDNYGHTSPFFACGRTLFEYIPQISKLAAARLVEEEAGHGNSGSDTTLDPHLTRTYHRIISALQSWESPPVDPRLSQWQQAHTCTGEVYRQALLIFAKVSLCGSLVDPEVVTEIQSHVSLSLSQMRVAAHSPFITLLMWPTMIVGSCTIFEPQRKAIYTGLGESEVIDTKQLLSARNLLRTLWDDDDPRAYGPFGLELVMKKNNINLSLG